MRALGSQDRFPHGCIFTKDTAFWLVNFLTLCLEMLKPVFPKYPTPLKKNLFRMPDVHLIYRLEVNVKRLFPFFLLLQVKADVFLKKYHDALISLN